MSQTPKRASPGIALPGLMMAGRIHTKEDNTMTDINSIDYSSEQNIKKLADMLSAGLSSEQLVRAYNDALDKRYDQVCSTTGIDIRGCANDYVARAAGSHIWFEIDSETGRFILAKDAACPNTWFWFDNSQIIITKDARKLIDPMYIARKLAEEGLWEDYSRYDPIVATIYDAWEEKLKNSN